MELFKIQRAFMELSELDETQTMKYYRLLEMSKFQVEKKIKPGTDIILNEPILVQFAASIAYYIYVVLQSKKAGSITAGNVKVDVDSSGQLKAAKELKDEMLLLASDVLVDKGFVFQSM